ncbi:TPA: cell-wall-anchored protein SasF [Staphylococcus aureus]|nr:cell-wall-anchored protein SasF [Staphylococcus aureus]HAR4330974.1 cell-wall-anchored protein SasF [Staphylococcus aureus]HCW9988564.1 cell-wall-anchored protein SasF [Staphylococcus aureus]HDJ2834920.1 cell-wall-anchored protein SasF [Staphylococcus aureus]HDJ3095507.1 cell-wall-anchored protein SasF [Staphylococcus aureus]
MAKYRGKPFRLYVKLSCSTMMATSIILTNILPYDAQAVSEKDTEISKEILSKQDLLDKVDKANRQIEQLKQLSASSKAHYKAQLNEAKTASQIDEIIKRANELDSKDNKGSHIEMNGQSDIDSKLDQLLKDLNEVSSKVDRGQQSDEDDLNAMKNDMSQTAATKHGEKDNKNDEAMVDNALEDLDHLSQQIRKSKDTSKDPEVSTTDNNHEVAKTPNNDDSGHGVLNKFLSNEENQSHSNRLTDKLQGSDKINHAMIEKLAKSNASTQHYTYHKLNTLQSLDQRIANTQLPKNQKSDLMSEVNKTKERIKSQRNIILEELARTDDKKHATQRILESIFNKDEADKILKDIRVDGKTDQQIADQITRHIDQLSLTTSDDLLTSLIDQSQDKSLLISQILQTKLGKAEADKLAKDWTNKGLSNRQIVDQLKKHFASTGDTSSDDILKAILNNAKDKKQAIETILATRIERQKAKLLADLITKIETDQNKIFNLVKSALNGKADDLLNLQKRLNQTKKDIDYILSPIVNRPSLLDRLNKNGKTTDLNKLANLMNQGSNLLDSIPDIPTPKPEKTLTLGKGNGLLNADGNISLPKAGETIKEHWLPISVIVGAMGVLMVWLSRRNKLKNKA